MATVKVFINSVMSELKEERGIVEEAVAERTEVFYVDYAGGLLNSF